MGILNWLDKALGSPSGSPKVSGDQWWAAANQATNARVKAECTAHELRRAADDDRAHANWMAKQAKQPATAITKGSRTTDESGQYTEQSHERAVEYGANKINPDKLTSEEKRWFAAMPTRTVERHTSREETRRRITDEEWGNE